MLDSRKLENKCLQNDDEKRAFFSISMFFFFSPIMEQEDHALHKQK